MKKSTNEIVIFFGISIALGGLFADFRNNPQLIVSVTFSAVCFAIFDLVQFYEKWVKFQRLLLFIGIFSVVVVPYLSFLTPFLTKQNNYFTLFGLAIVISLIGFRQNKQEHKDNESFRDKFNQQTEIIREQNAIIEEQNKIINLLNDAKKNPNIHKGERPKD